MEKVEAIIAIDPGPKKSAYVVWDNTLVLYHGIFYNNNLYTLFDEAMLFTNTMVIEQIKCYGMTVADSIFDTVFWSGRFAQRWLDINPLNNIVRVPRMDVKMHLCHDSRAKDANIRQALIDRFGPPGTKKNPGLTYGLKKDEWQALALAVYYWDTYIGDRHGTTT